MKRVFIYKITDEYSGITIGNYLKNKYHYSTKLIKAIKRTEDGILKNGERAFTSYPLISGDVLTININEPKSENIAPVQGEFETVYEDDDIMVINKPPNMPTHPSPDNYTNSLANALMYYFNEQGEDFTFHAVNRLDKDTSGLMLIAKNPYAHSRLSDILHTPDFVRRYICLVHGITERLGTVSAPIGRKAGSAIERTVTSDGQRAVTHYIKIGEYGDCSLLLITLETGRTHQIRVHLSHIGHPLVGDFLYGEEERDIAPRHMLHSKYIGFIHPVTGEKMELESEIPKDMKDVMKKIAKNIEIK